MFLLTGVLYPLMVTAITHFTAHHQAGGSLLMQGTKVVGSSLLAQQFEEERYFWPRPSAIDYHPLPSGGSQLAPTSNKLKDQVEARRAFLLSKGFLESEIPSELLFASASGLDPHITLQCALSQAKRVAKARSLSLAQVERQIYRLFEKRGLGFLGVPRVNVLKLNSAIDALKEEI